MKSGYSKPGYVPSISASSPYQTAQSLQYPIINYSTLPTRRVEITVGVSYQDNLKQAQELLVKIARENPKILDDPAPLVYVNNLGESSVDLLLLAYTQNDNFNPAKSEILEQNSQSTT